MTFVPGQGVRPGMSIQRTILFWLMMIALAAVLWQMASKGTTRNPTSSMTYSDFMNQVDQNNIASAKLFDSQNTAEIQGKLRQPSQNFKVTIPKEVISDLTERLRKQGVSIEVAASTQASWLSIVITLAPFIVIVGIWIFMMKQKMSNQRPPAGTLPSTGPLGG